MVSENREHERTGLLPISDASTPTNTQNSEATTALWQGSPGTAGRIQVGLKTFAERNDEHSIMPIEKSRPIPHTMKRTSTISRKRPSIPEVLDITFDHNRALDLELRPDFESNADTDCTDKSSQALSVSGHPSGWRHKARLKLGNWGWETGSCACSMAALFGLIGLLRAFDGKAQPDWPYGITLNSAMSFLSNMIKGFLLVPAAACISQSIWISYTMRSQPLDLLAVFDSASRGPWGAIELLWALKIRYSHVLIHQVQYTNLI
jgi:hypothetical protein